VRHYKNSGTHCNLHLLCCCCCWCRCVKPSFQEAAVDTMTRYGACFLATAAVHPNKPAAWWACGPLLLLVLLLLQQFVINRYPCSQPSPLLLLVLLSANGCAAGSRASGLSVAGGAASSNPCKGPCVLKLDASIPQLHGATTQALTADNWPALAAAATAALHILIRAVRSKQDCTPCTPCQ